MGVAPSKFDHLSIESHGFGGPSPYIHEISRTFWHSSKQWFAKLKYVNFRSIWCVQKSGLKDLFPPLAGRKEAGLRSPAKLNSPRHPAWSCQSFHWRWMSSSYGYGSIPIDTFLVGWTSIYQLFLGSLGTRVLTHPHISWACLGIVYRIPKNPVVNQHSSHENSLKSQFSPSLDS